MGVNMAKFIPTLGTDGWISEPEKVVDYLLSSFLTVNKSQSNLFPNRSDSFQSLLAEHTDNVYGLQVRLQEVLTAKLVASFDDRAVAEVTVVPLPDKPDQYTINFLGKVFVEDREYLVGKLVKTENSKLLEINEVNLNG